MFFFPHPPTHPPNDPKYFFLYTHNSCMIFFFSLTCFRIKKGRIKNANQFFLGFFISSNSQVAEQNTK